MSNARHRRAALLLFAAAGCSNSSPQAVNAPALVSPITVAPMSVIAGQPVMINCLVVDEKGVQHASPADAKPIVAFVPDSSVMTDKKGVVTAVRAGTVEARCGYPSLGLVDAKGASFTIAPAA